MQIPLQARDLCIIFKQALYTSREQWVTCVGPKRSGDLECKCFQVCRPQWVTQTSQFHTFPSQGHSLGKVLFSSVQSIIRVRLFAALWTAAHQASPSITNSWSLLKLMSIESAMPSNLLILCHPLLLLPSVIPIIRVFSSESVLCIRWLKYWSFR